MRDCRQVYLCNGCCPNVPEEPTQKPVNRQHYCVVCDAVTWRVVSVRELCREIGRLRTMVPPMVLEGR